MGWRPFSRNSKFKVLLTSLSIVMFIAILGARFVVPAAQSNEPEAPKGLASSFEETVAISVGAEETARIEGDDLPALIVDREAAAGPQPDDTGTLMPEPTLAQNAPVSMLRVGIQAGHWKSADLPTELAGLRISTGTSGGGVAEWQLNLDIARRMAPLLEAEGIEVDILPATIPPGYQANAFVALHADGDVSGRLSGFKLARASRSVIPEVDDALLIAITDEYRVATKLRLDANVTRNMTGYYAFSNRRFQHAIAPSTPAVIVEMGFLTNASDRLTLLGKPDTVAQGIARGVVRFLKTRVE